MAKINITQFTDEEFLLYENLILERYELVRNELSTNDNTIALRNFLRKKLNIHSFSTFMTNLIYKADNCLSWAKGIII